MLAVFGGLLAERPGTRAELVAVARERWPDHDADQLAYALYLLPTVQVTPRGLWRRSGRSAFMTVSRWLGEREIGEAPTLQDLVRRYLAAFGPANAADLRTWSGLPASRESLDDMRPDLRIFRDERGRELLDLPDAPCPTPTRPRRCASCPSTTTSSWHTPIAAASCPRASRPGWRWAGARCSWMASWPHAGSCWTGRGARSFAWSPSPGSRDDRAEVVREGELLMAVLAAGLVGEVRLIDEGQAPAWLR